MRNKIVFIVAAAAIAASWIGNYAYSRACRLPEAGFLRHYIETTTVPSVAFDLLYVANNDDKLKPINVQIDELPELRFYPVYVHQQMHRQTIYVLRGYYDENAMTKRKEEAEPLRLHTVRVFYNDGSVKEENVGEIVVHREAWPMDPSEDSLVDMMAGGSSSNGEGWNVIKAKQPVRLTGVSSVWLEKLGDALQFELKPNPSAYPMELSKGEMLSLNYTFKPSRQGADALNVYNVQLKMNFEGQSGEKDDYIVFAHDVPYPSEAEMRAYVREKRREAE
ncbi:hypothetical protein H7B90_19315 [Cohnella xylanilytica]|uniref:Uncharacterized protein n=1 Tax=Cohnella xylanilytica TaxID=557555 RepID=A0A841TZ42_9BACL|nr:hypothetical protein [Cohnella xylanilytica]MBB6693546.1 hypothetical protein [Cohnella xylanilytica]